MVPGYNVRGLSGDGATSDAGPSSSDSAYESSTDAGCVSDSASTRSGMSMSLVYSAGRYGSRAGYNSNSGRSGDASPRPYFMTYPAPPFNLMPSASQSPSSRDRDSSCDRNPSLVSSPHPQQMYRSASGHSSVGLHVDQRQISYGDEPGRGPRLKIPSPMHPQINHHHHHHHQQQENDQHLSEQQKHHQRLTAASPSHLLSPNAAAPTRDSYWNQGDRSPYADQHQLSPRSPRSPRSSVIISDSSSYPYYPSASSSTVTTAESLSVSATSSYLKGAQAQQQHMKEMIAPSSQGQIASPIYLGSSRTSPASVKQEQGPRLSLGHGYRSEHHLSGSGRQQQHQMAADLHRSPDIVQIKEETKTMEEDSLYKIGAGGDQKQSDSDYCSDRSVRDNGRDDMSPTLDQANAAPQDLSQREPSQPSSNWSKENVDGRNHSRSCCDGVPPSPTAAPASPSAQLFKHPQHQDHFSHKNSGNKFGSGSRGNDNLGSRLSVDGGKSVSQAFYASPASIIADLAKNDNLLSIAEDYQIDQFTGSEESVAQALCMVGDNIVMRFVHWMKHLPFCR